MPNSAARAAGVAVLFWLAAPLTLASIYRCSNERGAPLFSQYPCATADDAETFQTSETSEIIVLTRISVVTPAELTRSEQATLARIQRRFQRGRADALRDQRQARRRNTRRHAEQAAQCARSQDAMQRLRERKRGGYALSTARSLNAEERRLKAQVGEHCQGSRFSR
jgi:hypothetical protein